MKPFEEKVSRSRQIDFRLQRYCCEVAQFEWHYHQEYELVLYRHSQGQMFAGNYHGRFGHNSLALFGPHLPHTATSDSRKSDNSPVTFVLWFSQEWIQQILSAIPSLGAIHEVLQRAAQGVTFPAAVGEAVNTRFERMGQLSESQQALEVLQVLTSLTESPECTTLNPALSQNAEPDTDSTQAARVNRLMAFIEQNYHRPLSVQEASEALNLSPSTLRRLFARHFKESFSEHLKQFRIGKACEYLVNESLPVALIAERAGFQNLSNFNRQFRQVKGLTPRQFRRQFNPVLTP